MSHHKHVELARVRVTVPGMAIEGINSLNLNTQDYNTLQQIKHANDKYLNQQWGPNPYWGSQDMTPQALAAMSTIYAKHT
jgi:hypothetical protein